MKRLSPNRSTHEYYYELSVQHSEDVARLMAAAKAAGYEVSRTVLVELWLRVSTASDKLWLSLGESNDEELLQKLLQHAVVSETSANVNPPEGHASWLDYAVTTLNTREARMASMFDDDVPVISGESIRYVARAELELLREVARKGKSE